MSVSEKTILSLQNALSDKVIMNLMSQVDARSILEQTGESKENYPRFDPELTTKNTSIAYLEVACGCSMIEKGTDVEQGRMLLEQAGKILTDTYLHSGDGVKNSFHLLCASLALYISGQYSRAFVSLKTINVSEPLHELITLFIRKDLARLEEKATSIFFSDISNDDGAILFEVARIFLSLIAYLKVGDKKAILYCDETIESLIRLAMIDCNQETWLLLRMLKLMIAELEKNSLWSILPATIGESIMLSSYIKTLANKKDPIVELWPSQIEGVKKMHSNTSGTVVNLKTSGGKTRVAEIAIIESLVKDKDKKIVYLAPFRSLAFEVEQGFENIFGKMGISVSHLYGGATANSSDIELVSDSSILIMTPEKAKAIFRTKTDLLSSTGLVIIDEGHLISNQKRDIKNELFDTHLLLACRKNGAKTLFLSAVLPNASDIAKWVADDQMAVASSDYKPSLERPGYLIWNGESVSLRWKSEQELFNNNFVTKTRYGRNVFPKNKNEAIAATAIKLSNAGPVMIFSAVAKSIEGLAESVLKYYELTQAGTIFEWNPVCWENFEAACLEELADSSIIFEAAKRGIICHSNRLPSGVRIAIEKLMKSKTPRIIIASPTLAQGVNIGISTVIIATPYCYGEPITHRDFWNICGRAGRAYCDNEGKILFAIDNTEQAKKVRKLVNLGREYFNCDSLEAAKSGLLELVWITINQASIEGIPFDSLIDMLAEDNVSWNSEDGKVILGWWDWIDDELLAIDQDPLFTEKFSEIMEKSLLYIQATDHQKEKCIKAVEARLSGLKKRYGDTVSNIVSTGMQVSAADILLSNLAYFEQIIADYFSRELENDNDESIIFEVIDKWIVSNLADLLDDIPNLEDLNKIRSVWISGASIKLLRNENDKVDAIIKNYYQNSLPWILHSISQLFINIDKTEIGEKYSALASMAECGLPSLTAANMFYAGIHSRSACIELASIADFVGLSICETKKKLLKENFELSDYTNRHLNLLRHQTNQNVHRLDIQESLSIEGDDRPDYLFIRNDKGTIKLMSSLGQMYSYNSLSSKQEEALKNSAGYYLVKIEDKYYFRAYGK